MAISSHTHLLFHLISLVLAVFLLVLLSLQLVEAQILRDSEIIIIILIIILFILYIRVQ